MMLNKDQRAMFRAATEVAEERTRSLVNELTKKVLPGSQRVALEIPASSVTNHIDTSPIAEAVRESVSDTSPIARAIATLTALAERQNAPQVNIDLAPLALSLESNTQGMARLIEVQNNKIDALVGALAQLAKAMLEQKQVIPQESPGVVKLIAEQRNLFARMLDVLSDRPKRTIKISHGENESVVTEE